MNTNFYCRIVPIVIFVAQCAVETSASLGSLITHGAVVENTFASEEQLTIQSNTLEDESFDDKQVPFQMNLGAVFSENDATSALLADSVSKLITAILHNEITEEYITIEEQNRHSFFYKSLRNLGNKSIDQQLAPLVLKSFSPDDGETHIITVAFMKTQDELNQIYRIIEFHAYSHNDGFLFKSPFEYNTRNLATHQLGSVQFHLSMPLNRFRAQEFVDFKDMLESLVNQPSTLLDYYCFETLDNLLRAHGIVYDCTRCNWLKEDLGFLDNNGRSFLTGKGDERYIFEYLVDYMADRCDENSDLYPPFVYGIATYFGDYGLTGDDMLTLKAQFRNKLVEDPDINFLDEFKKGRKSSVNRHFSFYVMSAFICEEVISQHGNQAMLKLAHSGRSGDQFFNILEQQLGVNEDSFHALIERLITTKR